MLKYNRKIGATNHLSLINCSLTGAQSKPKHWQFATALENAGNGPKEVFVAEHESGNGSKTISNKTGVHCSAVSKIIHSNKNMEHDVYKTAPEQTLLAQCPEL